MKIVVYVDYCDVQFNTDFKLSNMLIGMGHNVFLAVNDDQFEDLRKKCDRAILGASAKMARYVDLYKVNYEDNVDNIIYQITQR